MDALKRLADAGGELSLVRLEAAIAAEDPAGFVLMVLQSIVANRHVGPVLPRDPSLINLWRFSRNSSPVRDREATEAKRNAVNVVRSILARNTGVIEGGKAIGVGRTRVPP